MPPVLGPEITRRVKSPPQPDIHRNNPDGIQKRMTALADRNPPLLIEDRLRAVVRPGKPGSGKDKVKLGEELNVFFNRRGLQSRLAAEVPPDLFDLLFSRISSSRRSLFSFTMAMGSIKRVEPVEDWS